MEPLQSPADNIAAVILGASVTCAEQVERFVASRSRKQGKVVAFAAGTFQDIVLEFAILFVHLTDREVLRSLGPREREPFMNRVGAKLNALGQTLTLTPAHPVPAFVRELRAGIMVRGLDLDLLNRRQSEYADLKVVAAPATPQLSGTLSWEFGKHIATKCGSESNAPVQMVAKILADKIAEQLPRLIATAN